MLTSLLSKISPTEWQRLRKFVHSPYHNSRTDIKELFDHLYQARKKQKDEEINLISIYKQAFPQLIGDEKQMRYLFSYFKKLVEQFLIYEQWSNDEALAQLTLAQVLRQRQGERLVNRTLERVRRKLKDGSARNANYHYKRYLYYQEQFAFTDQQSRATAISLQEMSDEWTICFVAERLRQACQALTYSQVSQKEFRPDLLGAILTFLQDSPILKLPAVAIYFHLYHMLSGSLEGDHFTIFRQLIAKDKAKFPAGELKEIYLLAINYGIRRFNNGEKSFLQEVFHLYQEGLRLGVFIENGHLSRFSYKNIVMAGLGLEAYDWVEDFLYNYKDKIHPAYRQDTFNYNLAIFYYRKPDYPKAMQLLGQVEFDDVLNALQAKSMLLKIYYDIGETEALYSLLDSFKIYVYRQRLLGYHKSNYLNLIRFVQAILKLRPYDENAKSTLKKKIDDTKALAEKAWLLSKLS